MVLEDSTVSAVPERTQVCQVRALVALSAAEARMMGVDELSRTRHLGVRSVTLPERPLGRTLARRRKVRR